MDLTPSTEERISLTKLKYSRLQWTLSSYSSLMDRESIREIKVNNIDDLESRREWLIDAIFKQKVSFLLIVIPFAALSHYMHWSPTVVFVLNFLGMIPLATILGEFTEELAIHTNPVTGGLINATFGNAVEVVVAVQALLANQIRVVQASMLGSIFSNLLLVLGSCFLFGGFYHTEQQFNSTSATSNLSLLALSSAALILPTPFAEYYDIGNEEVLLVSRIASIFLFIMYALLLIFQLKTHTFLFGEVEAQEETAVPFSLALGGLLFTTALITLLSEWLVQSIDGFVEESGLSKTFVGLILIPIVGNAVEHLTAVTMATRNKMDLALAIAIGSCTQIALFVVPLIVLIGWAVDIDMTINFPPFEIILFILSIFIVSIAMGNTKSNWLLGALLIITYIMIAIGFWFENVVNYVD